MSRGLIRVAVLAMVLVVIEAASNAQSPPSLMPSPGSDRATRPAIGQARFRQGVDLVSLDVSARDAMGRPLTDLAADDFLVFENGKPQSVSIVMPSGAVPLTVVLLIDHSMSMDGPKLARAQEAARLFVSQLRPEDRLEIIAFNQQAKRVLAFTDDPSGTATALSSIRAWGTTSIYEALLVAANDLVRARGGAEPETREVIVVLSDGEDTASVVGFDEALPVVRRSGAIVYALSLRTDAKGVWLGATWPLLELARDTGGRTLGVPILDKLPALYAEIAAEVRHLYRIGFVSTDERRDGQWRQVSVRVPTRDARVRTRAGYYAAGQPKAR
jgi:VWFA-related protein